jgi:nucleotide-binding universal stress UspA family protein
MSTILVPLDGSALAEQVLPYVRLFAPLLHASVCLLRVVSEAEIEQMLSYEVVRLEVGADQVMPHALREQRTRTLLCRRAEDYLDAHAAQLRGSGLTVESDVRVGLPKDRILQMAERTSSSLIAMATHGDSRLRRWALGSVTDKIVQAAQVPVLIVRSAASHDPPRLRHIMVALDGSELARQTLPLAVELAGGAQAELILFQAIAPTVEAYPYPPLPRVAQTLLRDQAHQELTGAAAQLGQRPPMVTPVVTPGDAAETIVEEAAQRHVDLIVMATHGWSGLRRWALGSVADKVLHTTTIPLLLVRARPPQCSG